MSPSGLIARQSVSLILRERIVTLLALMFVVLVLLSAWLGWSATATVNGIYINAAAFLTAAGQPVPPNPVLDISPLSLLRNMVIYVALIGALAAVVVGNQLAVMDRRSGALPLIGTRPLSPRDYAMGKLTALIWVVASLTAIAASVSIVTFALLPGTALTGAGWLKLTGFFGLSALYMLVFGLLGLGCAAWSRSESVGLLIPVTVWLTVTFILPSLTGNIHPTAAINPVSALAAAPDTAFFHWTGWLLGPFSLAESYKIAAARLLDFLPATFVARSAVPPLLSLLLAACAAAAGAIYALTTMDRTKGDVDV